MTPESSTPGRLLVGVDSSDGARRAVAWSAALAERTGSAVDAVHAISPWVGWEFAVIPFDTGEYRKAAEEAMTEDWCLPLAHVPHELHVEEAEAAVALLDLAHRLRPTLVVLGAHGHGRFSGKLLGSVTAKVLHACRRPVAVVAHDAPTAFGTLLVGVDGSPGSVAALRWAAMWAGKLDASVYGVCVLPANPYDHRPPLAEWDGPDQVAATLRGLRTLAGRITADTGTPIDTDVMLGHAGGVLIDMAHKDADVVILGSRGLGAFHEVVFGSTSRTVATHSPKTVVVVPHPEDDVD